MLTQSPPTANGSPEVPDVRPAGQAVSPSGARLPTQVGERRVIGPDRVRLPTQVGKRRVIGLDRVRLPTQVGKRQVAQPDGYVFRRRSALWDCLRV